MVMTRASSRGDAHGRTSMVRKARGMIRPAIMMWIALAVLGAAALFFVKFEVQTLDEQLAGLTIEKRAHE